MAELTGKIHSFDSFGAVDGPGIRFVVFFQGCPLRCLFCHNPDTWNMTEGKDYTPEEIVQEILPYRAFLRRGGVTLTGGEPLFQPAFAAELLRQLKAEGFHTAVDTSGAVPLELCKDAVDLADLLLLDIKALDPELCRTLTGQDNTHPLRLLRYCEEHQKPVWIRHVMVPGYTLDPKKLNRLAEFVKGFSCVKQVELLPFHQLGRYKWEELKLPYRLAETPVPTPDEVAAAQKIFSDAGLPVH